MSETRFQDIISKIESLTVRELSELVKTLEEKFGVSASQMTASSASQGGEADAAEEKTSFAVVLKAVGDQKINVIKIVKEVTGLGLKEANDIVTNVSKPIKEGVKKEAAEELKKKLEAVGAIVELQ